VKARTAAVNQIKGLLVSAPDKLRAKYRGLGTSAMITALQRTRPTGHMADPGYVCLLTLKALAGRCQSLAAEITAADAALQAILDTYAPMLCTAECKSKREIMRCLKRYAARGIYRQITNPKQPRQH
jgi:transposase